MVIIRGGMEKHPVIKILKRMGGRRQIHADAKQDDPDIELIAVHRWFQRKSVPSARWAALIAGAKARGIKITTDELLEAHKGEQTGHSVEPVDLSPQNQEQPPEKVNGVAP